MVDLKCHEKENIFLTSKGEQEAFPALQDPHSKELSVVVPFFNEELRYELYLMPVMMEEAMEYLEKRQVPCLSFFCETVIIVDDGNTDKTTELLKLHPDKTMVLFFQGTLSYRGKLILMANADGFHAWIFVAIYKTKALSLSLTFFFTAFCTFLMYGFHFLVWFFCVKGIRDTHCGFKIFTREAALRTFSSLHVERWAFDVELLYIAQCLKIPIAEVAVNWTEIEGSKLVPFWSWLQMGKDLIFIRLKYITGAWSLVD
ncbi:ALG5 glucosyltransferase, partial [Amia calva]|nr:ALG5 glucosyltransferase [Amia calva]